MRILFVQTGFLGDVILSTPVLSNLREIYPDAEIWAMTTPAAESLVRHHPAVFGTLPFDKRGSRRGLSGFFQMRSELRDLKFDAVFSLHKSLRTALLLWTSGIPLRYGFREAIGSFLYTHTASRSDLPHDALRNLAILRCLGSDPNKLQSRLTIAVPPEAQQRVEQLLEPALGRRLIGIAPGSVWETKRWVKGGFIEVAKHFAAEGAAIVIIGGPDDLSVAEYIAGALSDYIVINLVGRATLLESAGVISRLSLLIANDSAPLHLGSAAGIPVVGLFCATVPEFGFGPWQTISETVGVQGLSCRPCGRHGSMRCPTGTNACRLNLRPEEVIAAAERIAATVSSNQERIGEHS